METAADTVPRVLEILSSLTTPDSKASEKDTENQNRFDFLLDRNLQSYKDLLQKSKYADIKELLQQIGGSTMDTETDSTRWHFVCCCLNSLLLLQNSIEIEVAKFEKTQKDKASQDLKPSQAPPLSPDTLSIRQQKIVMTAIQFIVILGILPNLDEGVGIPVERRSEFAKSLLASGSEEKCSKLQKRWRIFKCIDVFMQCLKIPSIGALLLSRHLNDILVSLLQLTHSEAPVKTKTNSTLSASQTDSTIVSQQGTNTTEKDGVSPKESSTDNFTSLTNHLQDSSDTPPSKWTPSSVVDVVTSAKFQQEADTRQSKVSVTAESLQKEHGLEVTELEQCNAWLQQILDKVFPPMLVRELLLLQGGARPVKPNKSVNTGQKPVSASPVWLRRVCGRLLTDILMKPKGVINVLRGMLEGAGGTEAAGKVLESQTSDWRKCDAVAKVIACCPIQTSSVEEYYKHVAPQVLQLLHYPDKAVCRQFLRVACSTLSFMIKQQPTLTERHVLSPLKEPLMRCCQQQDSHREQRVVVEEKELDLCIEDIHKVFVCGIEPGSVVKCLLPLCHILFTLYSFTKKGVSHLRSPCLDIIVTVLKGADKEDSISCLQELTLGDCSRSRGMVMRRMHSSLMFAPGDKGGTIVVTRTTDSDEGHERDTGAVIDILKELQTVGLTGDFFLFLLMELTDLISKEIQGPHFAGSPHSEPGEELLEAEVRAETEVKDFHRKITILNLLASICEEIGPSCLKDTQQVLKFVQMTLERGIQVCKNTGEDVTQVFETETLTMAMGMLTAILTGTLKISDEDRNHMKTLMPLLDEISINHHDNTVQEMASDLRVAIATHGVIWSELLKKTKDLKMKSQNPSKEKPKTSESNKKPLVEVISETTESLNVCVPGDMKTGPCDQQEKQTVKMEGKSDIDEQKSESDTSQRPSADDSKDSNGKAQQKSELQLALENLQDALLPVRGHGLISLTKLLKKRDPEALEKQETLLKIFKENLYHPDSYLYLAAVNGLVSLADRMPDDILPLLTEQFLLPSSDQTTGEANPRKADNRIKVGECLVQVSRNLGDMSAKYRDLLLSAFLSGCKDKDSFVRASSLSNLGELCKVLKFAVGNFIQEILNCSCSLLKSDSSTEVRQAAGLMICLLLQGLGADSLKALDKVVHEVYRILRQTMITEKEDSVKVHVTLALNEIDTITRDVLFPKQTLQKRIRVLDPD